MLDRTQFLVRPRPGLFSVREIYDILDPDTMEKIGEAREEASTAKKATWLLFNKFLFSPTVDVYESTADGSEALLFSLKRSMGAFRYKLVLLDATGTKFGSFKPPILFLKMTFCVLDANDSEIARLKGDWQSKNFRFLLGETEVGVITKQRKPILKLLSRDSYLVSNHGDANTTINMFLISACLAIDTMAIMRRLKNP